MTIAIGINLGKYALLAADTRTTFYRNFFGKLVTNYDDNSVKIQKTTIGLITGSGCKQLLDDVKNRLAIQEITNTDEIMQIVNETRPKYRGPRWANQDITASTGWIYTYRASENGSPILRLDMIHPSLGEGTFRIPENQPAILPPCEATEEDVKEIEATLKKSIKSIGKSADLEKSVQSNWLLIAGIIREIQPLYASISPYCQIGVHTVEGAMGVSDILKDSEAHANITIG